MSEPSTMFDRVCTIISGELGCSLSDLQLNATADDVDGWDSLAHARLIMALEDKLGVRFPGERLFDLTCVGDLVDLAEATQKDTVHGNA